MEVAGLILVLALLLIGNAILEWRVNKLEARIKTAEPQLTTQHQ